MPDPTPNELEPAAHMVPALVEFLRARIGEEEAVAREVRDAVADEVARDAYGNGWEPYADGNPALWHADGNGGVPTVGASPQRVLDDCAARFRIIHANERRAAMIPAPDSEGRGFPEAAARMVLRLLSLPYRGHPDYRAEWSPDLT